MSESALGAALEELQKEQDEIETLMEVLERLIRRLPMNGNVSEPTAPKARKAPATRTKTKPTRNKRGSTMFVVRGVIPRNAKPFTAREVTTMASAKAGKDMHASEIRKALGLLVNMGEIKIVHDGTGRMDPTTWQAKAHKIKTDEDAEA